jgi:hypothetical protein
MIHLYINPTMHHIPMKPYRYSFIYASCINDNSLIHLHLCIMSMTTHSSNFIYAWHHMNMIPLDVNHKSINHLASVNPLTSINHLTSINQTFGINDNLIQQYPPLALMEIHDQGIKFCSKIQSAQNRFKPDESVGLVVANPTQLVSSQTDVGSERYCNLFIKSNR